MKNSGNGSVVKESRFEMHTILLQNALEML